MFSSVFEPAVVKTILKNRFSTQDAKAKFESEWNQNVSAQTLQKKLVLITTAGQATLEVLGKEPEEPVERKSSAELGGGSRRICRMRSQAYCRSQKQKGGNSSKPQEGSSYSRPPLSPPWVHSCPKTGYTPDYPRYFISSGNYSCTPLLLSNHQWMLSRVWFQ